MFGISVWITEDHACRQPCRPNRAHLVQALVPNTRWETPQATLPLPAVFTYALVDRDDLLLPLRVFLPLRILLIHQIHLVDQHPYARIRRVLSQRREDLVKVLQIRLPLRCRYVEDIYQHSDIGKDSILLGSQVVVDEGVLSTTVPEVLALARQK